MNLGKILCCEKCKEDSLRLIKKIENDITGVNILDVFLFSKQTKWVLNRYGKTIIKNILVEKNMRHSGDTFKKLVIIK